MGDAFERLESFKELKHNWDSYGAYPTDKRAIDACKMFLKHAPVVPINDGGVQIEWFGDDNVEIHVEFNPDGNIKSVYINDKQDKKDYEWELKE